MSFDQDTHFLINLIPFVSELQEMFHKWINLTDNQRKDFQRLYTNYNKNMEVDALIKAFERWDSMQDDGAPGVEMEIVVCDDDIFYKVVKSCKRFNTILNHFYGIDDDESD